MPEAKQQCRPDGEHLRLSYQRRRERRGQASIRWRREAGSRGGNVGDGMVDVEAADPQDPNWRALERAVIAHYEAAGYRVTPNVDLEGHQLDLLAQKVIDVGVVVSVMVEVKYREKGVVGVTEVGKFLVTARDLIGQGKVTHATMVTNRDYSQKARGKVTNPSPFKLITFEQLEQDMFQYSGSLTAMIGDYERNPIGYVALAGRPPREGKVCPDVVAHALDWAKRGEPLLVLSGDFGAGKTTCMERIRYEQAQRRLRVASARYPVLLRLRKLRQYDDLWSFIHAGLRNEQMLDPSRAAFEAQLQAGRLLILLDGFDEIQAGANAMQRGQFLSQLAPLLLSASPCILSTRPTYFESFDIFVGAFQGAVAPKLRLDATDEDIDLAAMAKYLGLSYAPALSASQLGNILELQRLSPEAVLAYFELHAPTLRAATGRSPQELKALFDQIYHLDDLMERPLLLKMVLATLLEGKVKLTGQDAAIGPSKLYRAYTQLSAGRDHGRPAERLSPPQRLAACRLLAMRMGVARRLGADASGHRAGADHAGRPVRVHRARLGRPRLWQWRRFPGERCPE